MLCSMLVSHNRCRPCMLTRPGHAWLFPSLCVSWLCRLCPTFASFALRVLALPWVWGPCLWRANMWAEETCRCWGHAIAVIICAGALCACVWALEVCSALLPFRGWGNRQPCCSVAAVSYAFGSCFATAVSVLKITMRNLESAGGCAGSALMWLGCSELEHYVESCGTPLHVLLCCMCRASFLTA